MGNCLTYHYDPQRSGATVGPSGDATSVKAWIKYNTLNLQATVRATPLVIEGWQIKTGPHAGETHTLVFVATASNEVLAFAEDDLFAGKSSPIWSQQLGPALNKRGSNLSPPIGVSSTPVIDLAHQRLFVIALQDDGHGNGVYHIHALDINTGSILQSSLVHDAGAASRATFDGTLQDQRGALNLVGDRVYTTFADFFANDKGAYHGWVIGCQIDHLNDQWFFPLTTTVLGGGAWGPGGVAAASDATLYVATGNAPNATAQYWAQFAAGGAHQNQHPGDIGDYFEAVVRLGTLPPPGKGLHAIDWYIPNNAQQLTAQDLDLGGSSVLLLPTLAGKQLAITTGKDGDVYLLDSQHLGRWGGELQRLHVFIAGAGSKMAPAHFLSSQGQHYVFVTGQGQPGLVAYKVMVNAGKASLVQAWQAGINFGDAPGSPLVARASQASDAALVWVASPRFGAPATLLAFNALDGTLVYDSSSRSSQDALGSIPHFAPLTCAGKSVFVGTIAGIACYGPPA